MRRFRRPNRPQAALLPRDLLPAGLLLLGMTAALAMEGLRPRAGLAVYAVLLPGQPVQRPDALAQDSKPWDAPAPTPLPSDWRIRRVVAAWPLTILLLDRLPGAPAGGVAGLRATLGAALLVSLPTGADCAGPAE